MLLDTFFLGCLRVVAIYSFPYQGFNGPLILLILYPSMTWCQIKIIIRIFFKVVQGAVHEQFGFHQAEKVLLVFETFFTLGGFFRCSAGWRSRLKERLSRWRG